MNRYRLEIYETGAKVYGPGVDLWFESDQINSARQMCAALNTAYQYGREEGKYDAR